MDDHLKVREEPDLIRSVQSKAILNTNAKELNKYRQERDEKMKLKKLIDENEQMKNDILEIKDLLRQMIGQK